MHAVHNFQKAKNRMDEEKAVKKPFEKELRADDTWANIKEEGNISKKTQHKCARAQEHNSAS
jgi:hypothetical protein